MQNSLAKFPKPELQVYLFFRRGEYPPVTLLKFLIETSKFGNPLFFSQVIISVMNQQDLLPYLQELVSKKMKIH